MVYSPYHKDQYQSQHSKGLGMSRLKEIKCEVEEDMDREAET